MTNFIKVNNINHYTNLGDIPVAEGRFMLIPRKESPLFYRLDTYLNSYVPVGKITPNFYTSNRHPNDKGNINTQRVIDYKIGDRKSNMIGLEESGWVGYDPIIVTKEEPIDRDDYIYHTLGKFIAVCTLVSNGYINHKTILEGIRGNNYPHYYERVLALPKHFSIEQLQMIVDGKLKDGDKVLVECVNNMYIHEGSGKHWEDAPTEMKKDLSKPEQYIKLDSQSHITLYPVEENKTYTKDVMASIITQFTEFAFDKNIQYHNEHQLRLIVDKWLKDHIK